MNIDIIIMIIISEVQYNNEVIFDSRLHPSCYNMVLPPGKWW